eukprot:698713-Amphidinium_carterae.1
MVIPLRLASASSTRSPRLCRWLECSAPLFPMPNTARHFAGATCGCMTSYCWSVTTSSETHM